MWYCGCLRGFWYSLWKGLWESLLLATSEKASGKVFMKASVVASRRVFMRYLDSLWDGFWKGLKGGGGDNVWIKAHLRGPSEGTKGGPLRESLRGILGPTGRGDVWTDAYYAIT